MKLYYRQYGSGPPLIILHALYGSSDNWVQIAKRLSGSYTCYLPDMRNHGRSPHSSSHDYQVMSDDIDELAGALHLEKFFLAGHSMGGKTAIHFALKYPGRLNGLLIADISPFNTISNYKAAYQQHLRILNTILNTDLKGINSRSEVESSLHRSIESEKIRGFLMKNLSRRSDGTFSWRINARSLLDNLNKIMEGIERPGYYADPVTGFPVLFLKGELSEYIPDSDLYDIQKIFPAAELVKVSRAGHWIQSDNPEEVTDNLLRLLD